jgi:NAD(P)H-flavin reductase
MHLDMAHVSGVAARVDPIARRMRRIRIEGAAVAQLEWTPGQHVRVHVTDMKDPRNWLHPRDFLRT